MARRRSQTIPRRRPQITTADHVDDQADTAPQKRQPPRPHSTKPRQERAYLVAVDSGHRAGEMSTDESVRELGRLVRTAGGYVVASTTQRRPHPDPATYLGSGKVEEIVEQRQALDYTMVVFD
ncbi:MAG: hypothetical protein WEA81_04415, partial [Dehalococcoidia bacterium]